MTVPGGAAFAEAARYAEWFETPLGRAVWRAEWTVLESQIHARPVGLVLDAGAGDGRIAIELARHGSRVVALDGSRAMLAAARNRVQAAETPVALVAGRVAELPVVSGSIQTVVANTILCVAEKPEAVMAEFARVLRRGGRAIVADLGRWSSWAARRRVQGWVRGGFWLHARFWTFRGLARLMREAGLAVINRAAAVYFPPHAGLARALLPWEARLRWLGDLGAAYLVLEGRKP